MANKEELIKLLITIKHTRTGPEHRYEWLAYNKVIQELESYTGPFERNIILGFSGVGKKIGSLINEYFNTGKIGEANEILNSPEFSNSDSRTNPNPNFSKVETMKQFQEIHSVGLIKSEEWYNLGYRCLQDIPLNQCTENQKVSIQLYNELKQRIPRKEIEYIEMELFKYFKNVNNIIICNVAGSYRRGLSDSGDIDVIVCSTNFELMKALIQNFPYLTKIMYNGEKKLTGIIKIPEIGGISRQIDFEYVKPNEYFFAELYFTGSKEHNIKMRSKANELC